jgi:hypothetical protein
MLIDEPTCPLGEYDCRELTERVLALDESVWHRDQRRQQDHDVHAQTQSLILLFCSGWPELSVARAEGWDLLADAALPVMDRIIADSYPPGGTVIRAMMARLPPGKRIARHRDSHPSFNIAHRVHVPLQTNPDVEFIVGKELVPPRAHFAFELNNRVEHQVCNRGTAHRIHFIFDYAPPRAA